MTDTKISALTSATTPLDGTEVLPIVQSGTTKKAANNDLRPKQIQSNATSGVLQVTGPGVGATRVMTTPDANFTAARTDAAQTFTGNQTFSSDVILPDTKTANFLASTAQDFDFSGAVITGISYFTNSYLFIITNSQYDSSGSQVMNGYHIMIRPDASTCVVYKIWDGSSANMIASVTASVVSTTNLRVTVTSGTGWNAGGGNGTASVRLMRGTMFV